MAASPSARTRSASDRRCAASRPSPAGSGPGAAHGLPRGSAARAASNGPMNEIKIALLGLGTVGCGVAKILQSHGAELAERAGCRLAFARVADADLTRPRDGLDLARLPLTADAGQAIDDPSVQIVIELIGGLDPARPFLLPALQAGHPPAAPTKAPLPPPPTRRVAVP